MCSVITCHRHSHEVEYTIFYIRIFLIIIILQARQLGSYMRRTTFTKAFSSDLQRAHNTGKQILEQLEARPEIAKDLRLRERVSRNYLSVKSYK